MTRDRQKEGEVEERIYSERQRYNIQSLLSSYPDDSQNSLQRNGPAEESEYLNLSAGQIQEDEDEICHGCDSLWWDHLGKTKRYTEEDIGEYMAINLKEVVL